MSKPKELLIKIGALDVLTKIILEIAIPILFFFWSRVGRIYFTPAQILRTILAVIGGTLVEIAVVFLIVKGCLIGIILKSIYNFIFGIYCLMNLRLIFLSAASTMFRSRINISVFLFVFSGLHFAFSVYFQYIVMFNKPIKTYISEEKNKRIQRLHKND